MDRRGGSARRWCLVGAALAGVGFSTSGARADTRTVVAGPQYEASGFHELWLGEGYRDLWVTPVELEVLDLAHEAGGLTPVMRVGGMQTPGLALKGGDGRSYTFRWIDKDPSRLLPDSWAGSPLTALVRDQTAASHPGVALVLQGLIEAIGTIPYTHQRLVVMPDDPVLGEHRDLFANSVGTFGEYPRAAHDGLPGFMGATEILSSLKMWDRWREDPHSHADASAFLACRVLDLLVGNWDRHRGQWRWARIPERTRLQPIPEDPDQVFSDYSGILLAWARWKAPILVEFEDHVAGMEGMAANGADVDRLILSSLERAAFERAATDVQAALTDEAIDRAVARLPAEWHAVSGAALAARLKRRRDNLLEGIERYYEHLAAEVDVHGTDRDEIVRVERFEDGAAEVSLAVAGSEDQPYFRRRFVPSETDEVRLYLYGGDDRLISTGPAHGAIKIRMIGGAGNDVLDDRRGGLTHLVDAEGDNRAHEGPGTRVHAHPYANPAPNPLAPWMAPRDFGHRWVPGLTAWWEPDLGVYAAGSLTDTRWGFRKYPYASRSSIAAGYSTRRTAFRIEYRGSFQRMSSRLSSEIHAQVSGIERLNFYGFGNETLEVEEDERYRVKHQSLLLAPAVSWLPHANLELRLGPTLRLSEETSADTLIHERAPYGSGEFGQVGAVVAADWASRGIREGSTLAVLTQGAKRARRYSGYRVRVAGSYVPPVWSVDEAFGWAEGSAAGSLGLGASERVVLAARAGGRHVWGDRFPWYAAAFVGGPQSNRAFQEQRFAGRSSVFGNLEVRVHVVDGIVIVPGRWWVFGLLDVGRVWIEAEESRDWHPSFGGGLGLEVMGTPITLWAGIASNAEEDSPRFYLNTGLGF